MIVKLTKEQIIVLVLAMGSYVDKIYEQTFLTSADDKKSRKAVRAIMDAFNTATEE